MLDEARSWLGTPYHHMGRVKGGAGCGCDCLTLLAEVYARAGIVSPVEVPYYRPDLMLHRGEETYLEGLLAHGSEVAAPSPATRSSSNGAAYWAMPASSRCGRR